jgi:hypothetical protein
MTTRLASRALPVLKTALSRSFGAQSQQFKPKRSWLSDPAVSNLTQMRRAAGPSRGRA